MGWVTLRLRRCSFHSGLFRSSCVRPITTALPCCNCRLTPLFVAPIFCQAELNGTGLAHATFLACICVLVLHFATSGIDKSATTGCPLSAAHTFQKDVLMPIFFNCYVLTPPNPSITRLARSREMSLSLTVGQMVKLPIF